MMTRKQKFVAGLGAVALSSVIALGTAHSANYTIESGQSFPMDLQTTVNNAIDVTVVDMELGTFGTVKDPADTLTATATLDPDGTFNEDIATAAKIVDANLGDHAAAEITVSAFPDTLVFVDYDDLLDLDDNTTGTFVLQVTALLDNLDAPPTGVNGVAGTYDGVGNTGTQGSATTTPAGDLVFNIGASFVTGAAVTYPSDDYVGSFNMTISY